eukprot:scaffold882_cov384-Pavlova_lutheri.AAC.12
MTARSQGHKLLKSGLTFLHPCSSSAQYGCATHTVHVAGKTDTFSDTTMFTALRWTLSKDNSFLYLSQDNVLLVHAS